MSRKLKNKKYGGTQLGMEYVKGTVKNLMLDKPVKALPSTHNRVDGKDVPVNKQIVNYLKSMSMLEKSTEELEDVVEKSEDKLEETKLLFESNIIKKKYRGRTYASTPEMIRAVKLEAQGKLSYKSLREMIGWHEDPDGLIEVSRMIAGIGSFRR